MNFRRPLGRGSWPSASWIDRRSRLLNRGCPIAASIKRWILCAWFIGWSRERLEFSPFREWKGKFVERTLVKRFSADVAKHPREFLDPRLRCSPRALDLPFHRQSRVLPRSNGNRNATFIVDSFIHDSFHSFCSPSAAPTPFATRTHCNKKSPE